MKAVLVIILCASIFLSASGQEKEKAFKINCYVNPELYLQAGIISYISNPSGSTDCKGSYLTIFNGSKASLFFRQISDTTTAPEASGGRSAIKASEVKAGRQVTVRISEPLKDVDLGTWALAYFRFTPSSTDDAEIRKRALSKMNASTDRLRKSQVSPQSPARTGVGDSTRLAVEEGVSVAVPKDSASSPNCFTETKPAYHTFFYLRHGEHIFYSAPFGIPAYSTQTEARELLAEKLSCLKGLLKGLRSDTLPGLVALADKDLQEGFIGLRNVDINSSQISALYPWSLSESGAKGELAGWIDFDKKKGPETDFTKIPGMP